MSVSSPVKPLRVAVFASGAGTTFRALVEAGRSGQMSAEVVLLIASRAEVAALAVADELGVESAVLDERVIGPEQADQQALALLTSRDVGLVVLAGYVRKVGPRTLAAFPGRMLNTHPAPLPRFGGRGMYGEHVHRAVLKSGAAQSAATVHLVDAEYDTGPVVGELAVPVLLGDDVASLRARVQAAERELLVATVASFAGGSGQQASDLDLLIIRRRQELARPVLVAVDGRSGTGKSTFAEELAHRHEGRVITADDFWSGGDDEYWRALLPQERADRAIDWRRLREEVLEPLLAGHPARWRTFNWETGEGLSEQRLSCEPAPVLVLDGAYSARPELIDLIDVSVLLTLDDGTRRARLLAREGGEFMRNWHTIWDAAEDHYFEVVRTPDSFDVVLVLD